MGRLAIFLDGGYIDHISRREFDISLSYGKLSLAITAEVATRSADPVELLRSFYYNCLPYQSPRPSPEESIRLSKSMSFMDHLRREPRYEVRLGRLKYRGNDADGQPIFQQKRVDLLLGIDITLLAGKHQISHAAILAGDSDLIPAVEVAKQEGVCVWLIHGPARSRTSGSTTYARELWDIADERIELTQKFMNNCRL
jgi:uncharacterized LabA/DUF88 family protein